MVSYEVYWIVKCFAPPAVAVLAFIAAGFVICCLKGKAVSIIFPYIKKHGNYTVAFGFILKKGQIILHYFHICFIFSIVTWIFFNSFLLKDSTWYNPYVDCFFNNGTEVGQLTSEEALRLEDNVTCFVWNIDIGEAAGEVTGILALTWIVVSVMIYAQLKCGLEVKKCLNSKKRRKLGVCCKYAIVLACLIIYIVCAIAIPLALTFIIIEWIPDYVSPVPSCTFKLDCLL